MNERRPRVSFGVPVRNGEATIGRCLDSILQQDFQDFEVIVSDNASTDSTCARVESIAARDPRVRLVRQATNVGLIENFNALARAARGELFRWVGADDWLEPEYTSTCVSALDAHPDAIVATSGFDLVDPAGGSIARDYVGEFLESPKPTRRLARLLWFFHAGLGLYEANYCLIRHESLLASGLLPIHRKCDWLFSARLCLQGPFVHVPKRLFHRSWTNPDRAALAGLASRLHPVPRPALEQSIWQLYRGLAGVVAGAELGLADRLLCQLMVLQFCLSDGGMRVLRSVRQFRRSLGLTRSRLRGSPGNPRPD
ncbi:MAG: glycosyltransferase family A protein [Myxococcota bacterium]